MISGCFPLVDTVLLLISAAQDLARERDVLDRAIVDNPTTLGWRTVQSPIQGKGVDRELVARTDFHQVLLAGTFVRRLG